MRKADAIGGSSLILTAAVAVVLGLHGMNHPGPIMTAAGAGALPGSTQAAGAGAQTGTTSSSQGTSASSSSSAAAAPSSSAQGGATSSSTAKKTASGMTVTSQLLSQSQYAPFAVPVYPTRAAAAAQALSGFGLTVTPATGGLYKVVVTVSGSSQAAYTQTIDATDKVYFIEGQMGDDAPGSDVNYGDDGVIITNQKGYILQ